VVHCSSERQALQVKESLVRRFAACGLELHPDKSRIVYCKDSSRRGQYPHVQFTFLGFTFRPRSAISSSGIRFTSFLPGVSREALTRMRRQIRSWHLARQTSGTLREFSQTYGSTLAGWWNYYSSFYPSSLHSVFRHFDLALACWVRRKYKRLSRHKSRSRHWVAAIARREPHLFVHWRKWFANGRTMGAV
jgi:hypothetical protein